MNTKVEAVQRFDLAKVSDGDFHHDHVMEPCETGEWVRYADIQDEYNKVREDFVDINEYWNGGNGSAVDAAQHAVDVLSLIHI